MDEKVNGSNVKTVFISYSWDSPKHKLWVLKFANDLMKISINVRIDEWHLKKYGGDINSFMKKGINKANYVLIICTPLYKQRADERKGNVGAESDFITEDFDRGNKGKYLPILREGHQDECRPNYLMSKQYYDFRNDDEYKDKLEELWRIIYDQPLIKPPPLGEMPPFESFHIEEYLKRQEEEMKKEEFAIVEPKQQIVYQEWTSVGGKGCPEKYVVFLINELPDRGDFWLQPDFAVPDENGNWIHDKCNTLATNVHRNVYAIAVKNRDLIKMKEVFLDKETGDNVLRVQNINYVERIVNERIGDVIISTPIVIIRN